MQHSSSRRTAPIADDDVAVSEVLGQILIFGILSITLVGAMVGFNVAKESATERILELRADAQAQVIELRIREAAEMASLHHTHSPSSGNFSYSFALNLDSEIEGYNYRIQLATNQINVTIPAIDYTAVVPIHQSESATVKVCGGIELAGQNLVVRALRVDGANPSPIAGCSGSYILFLEEAA